MTAMDRLTIGLLQMTAGGMDLEANKAKGEAFCRRAHEMGADIALFPEMWSIGYQFYVPWDEVGPADDVWRAPELWTAEDAARAQPAQAIADWQAQAIGRDDPFINHFRALARELGMAIAITYLERWAGPPRNTVSLIDRHGEIVLTYAKVHTCDFGVESACTPGDDFYVCTLDTARGAVKIGAMICYDREFPESARVLMLKGAEIILTPNACELETNRLGQFRARAYENMVGVAMANYAGPSGGGHSAAYDPIAFDADGRSRDMTVIEAGEQEGVYLAHFDLEVLRTYRIRETWGNAFRKPSRYGALTSSDVGEPFIRVNAAGERYDRSGR
jgi:N-carbamoylputrescine amidase